MIAPTSDLRKNSCSLEPSPRIPRPLSKVTLPAHQGQFWSGNGRNTQRSERHKDTAHKCVGKKKKKRFVGSKWSVPPQVPINVPPTSPSSNPFTRSFPGEFFYILAHSALFCSEFFSDPSLSTPPTLVQHPVGLAKQSSWRHPPSPFLILYPDLLATKSFQDILLLSQQ